VDAHTAGEEGDGQEEADDEHGDQHENPCEWLYSAKAEGLKDTCTDDAYHEPPHKTVHILR
jgi:hypothetical protein